ncbi:MAG: Uncharacterized protein XD63_1122 [Thermoanaerobacterales bacterium 50_218]|nr:MAG: Uncharacterized protein XD63_1122 [Thermoanaerobacterales bacterium 50_218]HAA90149.1 hypothetical protein [Peptococcaceae bacterium]
MENFFLDIDNIDIRPVVGGVLLFVHGLSELTQRLSGLCEAQGRSSDAFYPRVCAQVFAWVLEEIDTRLMETRDRATWEVVGFQERTVVTSFGEVLIKEASLQERGDG